MFSNEIIDTRELPRFETVNFTPLHADYWKVTAIGIGVFYAIVGVAIGAALFLNQHAAAYAGWFWGVFAILLLSTTIYSRLAFNRKGYAFREHDVLFKSGVIAHKTMVIPYNRVQHVALHEGFLARRFGLAEVQVFTAGGSGSDLEIPGIPKERAEDIKQLLMGKIRTSL